MDIHFFIHGIKLGLLNPPFATGNWNVVKLSRCSGNGETDSVFCQKNPVINDLHIFLTSLNLRRKRNRELIVFLAFITKMKVGRALVFYFMQKCDSQYLSTFIGILLGCKSWKTRTRAGTRGSILSNSCRWNAIKLEKWHIILVIPRNPSTFTDT